MAAASRSSDKIFKPTKYEKELIGKMLQDQITCSICLDTFLMPRGLCCKHVFCDGCLLDWRRNHDTCPICRNPIHESTVKCEWLESIINHLKGVNVVSSTPIKNHRRSRLKSMSGSSVRSRPNGGKENIQNPPWRY